MATSRRIGYTTQIVSHTGGERGLPPVYMMVHEQNGGGYTISLELRPVVANAEAALHAVIDHGISPGESAVVRLNLNGSARAVRTWPCVVTSIATRDARRGEDDPAVIITLADPFTACGNRNLWLAFSDVDLAEVIGAALSATGGGDGMPSRNPVIPGLGPIEIRTDVRETIRDLPYVIAAGETLREWMESMSGLLKIRMELVGLEDGKLVVTITDRSPRVSAMNDKGAIPLYIKMKEPVSARNVWISKPRTAVWPQERGGMMDVPSQGIPSRFGPEGPIGSVLQGAQMERDEGETRETMNNARGKSSQVRIKIESAQPGLIPGRIVSFEDPPKDRDGNLLAPLMIFGAARWQIIEVAHVFVHGGYQCTAEAEKSGVPWHHMQSEVPREMRMVSGILDDGESKPGEAVRQDRLGMLPVCLAFCAHLDPGADVSWSETLDLISSFPTGGGEHGFVSDTRQGDVCRVRVHTPLFAEIAGFSYCDDRTIKKTIREATSGFVVHQGVEEWRGMKFEAVEQEK